MSRIMNPRNQLNAKLLQEAKGTYSNFGIGTYDNHSYRNSASQIHSKPGIFVPTYTLVQLSNVYTITYAMYRCTYRRKI